MKVLVVGKFGVEEFGWHISTTLQAMGHDVQRHEIGYKRDNQAGPLKKRVESGVVLLEQLARQVPQVAVQLSRALLREAGRDIDLTIVTHDLLTPDQVLGLRQRTGAPVVLWFPDAISQLGKAMFLNAPYDFLFFKEPYLVRAFRTDLHKPAYYLPECCNPEVHRPVELSDADRQLYDCDIVQAGNMNANRVALFGMLTRYQVKLWGNSPPLWMHTGQIDKMLQRRFVAYEDKSRAFLGGKVLLNNLYPSELEGINARAFEAAGIGAFQLISHRSGLARLFVPGQEVVSFESYDDLIEKLDHYLPLEEERRRIGHNAHLRAFRDHTYRQRLQLLIETTQGQAEGFGTA
jgi:spore maturation protein CgeB